MCWSQSRGGKSKLQEQPSCTLSRRKQTEPHAAFVGSLMQLFPGIFASKQTGKREKSPLPCCAEPQMITCGTGAGQGRGEAKAEVGRAPALAGHAHRTPAQVGVSWPGSEPAESSQELLCAQGPQNCSKDTEKKATYSSFPFTRDIGARGTFPAIPSWEQFDNRQGEMPFPWAEWPGAPQSRGKDFPTVKAVISPLSLSQDCPCPFLTPWPSLAVGCSAAPCTSLSLSLHFHLPNSQSSPELHLCLHLCAYLLCSHPGLHPCPFPYHPDFTHTTPWLLPCPPASSHRSPGARARSCSTPKLPYWDFLA